MCFYQRKLSGRGRNVSVQSFYDIKICICLNSERQKKTVYICNLMTRKPGSATGSCSWMKSCFHWSQVACSFAPCIIHGHFPEAKNITQVCMNIAKSLDENEHISIFTKKYATKQIEIGQKQLGRNRKKNTLRKYQIKGSKIINEMSSYLHHFFVSPSLISVLLRWPDCYFC